MRTFGTIADIDEATSDGSFDENHYLEAKTLLKTKTPSDKDELARDLAQFAFDGGTVVFGVREDKGNAQQRFSTAPFELGTNIREQIEQIAQERCSPPLPVRVREVRSKEQTGMGCIVVEVPPSSRAPHMVGSKYPFRGDATRRFLGDSEVRMWIARAEDVHERVAREVQALTSRDPYPDPSPRAGHLFAVALPLTSRHDELPAKGDLYGMLSSASNDFQGHWRGRFSHGDQRARTHLRSTALSSVREIHARSSEYVLRTQRLSDLESGRPTDPGEDHLAEWAVDTSGAIRVYDSGLSVHRRGRQGGLVHAIWSEAPVEMLGILVESARLSGERMGYHGQWGFGVAWTGLRGAQKSPEDPFAHFPVVDRDEGSHQHLASALEVHENPTDVVVRLALPILRTFGDEDYLYPFDK